MSATIETVTKETLAAQLKNLEDALQKNQAQFVKEIEPLANEAAHWIYSYKRLIPLEQMYETLHHTDWESGIATHISFKKRSEDAKKAFDDKQKAQNEILEKQKAEIVQISNQLKSMSSAASSK
jgi:hypothetical protein